MDFPNLIYNGKPSLPPQKQDLDRLHSMITESFSTTVLEFGCGYSTFVISDALRINRERFDKLDPKPEVRNSQLFRCYSVDTDRDWLKEIRNKLDDDNMNLWHSPCDVGLFNGQMCHYYTKLPDIVPDFIYLDGPDPAQVDGSINGLSFKCPERTPMSADVLLMEPILIPGTTVLIDGRTNNFRFLRKNLKRLWAIYSENDMSWIRLEEDKLGKINVVGRDLWQAENNSKHV